MITKENVDAMRMELSIKAKNGIDFIIAASIIWLIITYVWILPYTPYNKSVLTFIVGGLMLPLAFLISKILKTSWSIKDNPLQPLGLWFNFAQLFYFPFLIFTLIKMPEYFVMVYVVITGAHFFPYAWYYKINLYAVFAGIISLGALVLALLLPGDKLYYIPLFMSANLIVLSILLHANVRKRTPSK